MSLSLYPNVVNKKLFVQDTSPAYATPGDQWFHTSRGILLIYVKDDTGKSYWMETGSSVSDGS